MPSADAAPNSSPPDADSFVARLEDGWQRALVPAFLVLSYLYYATPYLLVVADAPVGEALGRSYEWALAGGPYFAYLLFVAAVSAAGTVVVVNLGAVGILLGAVASAPVALALTFATTEFVAEMADERTDEFRNDGAGWA